MSHGRQPPLAHECKPTGPTASRWLHALVKPSCYLRITHAGTPRPSINLGTAGTNMLIDARKDSAQRASSAWLVNGKSLPATPKNIMGSILEDQCCTAHVSLQSIGASDRRRKLKQSTISSLGKT